MSLNKLPYDTLNIICNFIPSFKIVKELMIFLNKHWKGMLLNHCIKIVFPKKSQINWVTNLYFNENIPVDNIYDIFPNLKAITIDMVYCRDLVYSTVRDTDHKLFITYSIKELIKNKIDTLEIIGNSRFNSVGFLIPSNIKHLILNDIEANIMFENTMMDSLEIKNTCGVYIRNETFIKKVIISHNSELHMMHTTIFGSQKNVLTSKFELYITNKHLKIVLSPIYRKYDGVRGFKL